MLPFICCCCGGRIESVASSNPNLCAKCLAEFWSDISEVGILPKLPRLPELSVRSAEIQNPQELEHMLEVEGPSVIEVFNAVEQAVQALAEAKVNEQKAEAHAADASETPSPIEPAPSSWGVGVAS